MDVKELDRKIRFHDREAEKLTRERYRLEIKIERLLEKGGPLFKREKRLGFEKQLGVLKREISAHEDAASSFEAERSQITRR